MYYGNAAHRFFRKDWISLESVFQESHIPPHPKIKTRSWVSGLGYLPDGDTVNKLKLVEVSILLKTVGRKFNCWTGVLKKPSSCC